MLFGSKNSREKQIKNYNEVIKILENFDKYTNYKYTHYINQKKEACIIEIALINKDIRKIRGSSKYKSMKMIDKIQLYIRLYSPKTYLIIVKLKEKIKQLV